MIEHNGQFQGSGRRFGVVVSRFNDLITRPLLAGAHDCLLRHGVAGDAIEVVWVPGAWESPARCACSRAPDASTRCSRSAA